MTKWAPLLSGLALLLFSAACGSRPALSYATASALIKDYRAKTCPKETVALPNAPATPIAKSCLFTTSAVSVRNVSWDTRSSAHVEFTETLALTDEGRQLNGAGLLALPGGAAPSEAHAFRIYSAHLIVDDGDTWHVVSVTKAD